MIWYWNSLPPELWEINFYHPWVDIFSYSTEEISKHNTYTHIYTMMLWELLQPIHSKIPAHLGMVSYTINAAIKLVCFLHWLLDLVPVSFFCKWLWAASLPLIKELFLIFSSNLVGLIYSIHLHLVSMWIPTPHLPDVGFFSVCCEYHWLIKKRKCLRPT